MLSYQICAQIDCFTINNIVVNACTILVLHNYITMCEQRYNNSIMSSWIILYTLTI